MRQPEVLVPQVPSSWESLYSASASEVPLVSFLSTNGGISKRSVRWSQPKRALGLPRMPSEFVSAYVSITILSRNCEHAWKIPDRNRSAGRH